MTALTGTYADRLAEAIKFAETSRARAKKIISEVRETVTHELMSRYRGLESAMPVSEAQISAVVDARVAEDPRFKAAVQNEQWGCRLVAMYSAIQTINVLRDQLATQRQLVREQRETNDLLRMLVMANAANGVHTVSGVPTTPTIVRQRDGVKANT